MKTATVNRRKKIVVNRELQRRFVKAVSWPWIAAVGVSMGTVFMFALRLMLESLNSDVQLPSMVPLFVSVSAMVVLTTFFALYFTLRLSNRIAGPAYRVNRVIESAMQGDLSVRITLRDGDFLTEVADDLNRLLAWTEGQLQGVEGRDHADRDSRSNPEPTPVASGELA